MVDLVLRLGQLSIWCLCFAESDPLCKTLTCPVFLSSGASSATMLIFILPAGFYLKLVKKEPLRSPQKVGVSKTCNFPHYKLFFDYSESTRKYTWFKKKIWIAEQGWTIKDELEFSGGEKEGWSSGSDDSGISSLQIPNILGWVLPTCQRLMECSHRHTCILSPHSAFVALFYGKLHRKDSVHKRFGHTR